MPMDMKKYPKNWKWLSKQIIKREANRCGLCHVKNGENYWRDDSGFPFASEMRGFNKVKIVLTVHHINYDPSDNREYNLIALCQRCHLRLDLPFKLKKRAGRGNE